MVSWLLGGVEVCLALHFLGHDVGIVPGLIIESLGQALKAVGFAVPGALGVQEGGYIVICRIFGLSPEVAIALSLMKRLREVGLGVPGLLAWHRAEARPAADPALPMPGRAPVIGNVLDPSAGAGRGGATDGHPGAAEPSDDAAPVVGVAACVCFALGSDAGHGVGRRTVAGLGVSGPCGRRVGADRQHEEPRRPYLRLLHR